MNKKKKSTNTSPYPDEVIDRLARAFYAILACWNSEVGQREFAAWQADQMIPSRTTVRLGIFLFFGSRRFGKIKINKHFRVCDLDAIYKGINDLRL